MARDDDTQVTRRKFGIDKRINLGDLIQIALIACGGFWFIATMHTDIAVLNTTVTGMREDISDIRKSVGQSVADINHRIDEIVEGRR